MPRQRTGSLQLTPAGYFAKVTVDVVGEDGVARPERRTINLETQDRGVAKRKLAKLVRELNAGHIVADAKKEIAKPVTVAEYVADTFIPRRERREIAGLPSDRSMLKHHVLPLIGKLPLARVSRSHVRDVFEQAADDGLARSTLAHARWLVAAIFNDAIDDGLIEMNPADRVKLPVVKADARPFATLTDDELSRWFATPGRDLEIRVLALFARVLGGARRAERMRLDWSTIDVESFALVTMVRAKGGKPQTLEIPELLRPFLRAWWTAHAAPRTGAVFPGRKGRNKGTHRDSRTANLAGRLRLSLLRAGIVRHDCTRPANAPRVAYGEACCPNHAHDSLYSDTPTSRHIGFHSQRRAFVTALATAGVAEQHAMKLANHASSTIHRRYVMDAPSLRSMPTAALPSIGATNDGDESDMADTIPMAAGHDTTGNRARSRVDGVSCDTSARSTGSPRAPSASRSRSRSAPPSSVCCTASRRCCCPRSRPSVSTSSRCSHPADEASRGTFPRLRRSSR
jgi:integrase